MATSSSSSSSSSSSLSSLSFCQLYSSTPSEIELHCRERIRAPTFNWIFGVQHFLSDREVCLSLATSRLWAKYAWILCRARMIGKYVNLVIREYPKPWTRADQLAGVPFLKQLPICTALFDPCQRLSNDPALPFISCYKTQIERLRARSSVMLMPWVYIDWMQTVRKGKATGGFHEPAVKRQRIETRPLFQPGVGVFLNDSRYQSHRLLIFHPRSVTFACIAGANFDFEHFDYHVLALETYFTRLCQNQTVGTLEKDAEGSLVEKSDRSVALFSPCVTPL